MAIELVEENSLEDYGSPKAYAGFVLASFMATLWQLAWGQARTLNNARVVLATSNSKPHSPFFLIYFCFSLFFLHLQHFALCNICCAAHHTRLSSLVIYHKFPSSFKAHSGKVLYFWHLTFWCKLTKFFEGCHNPHPL